MEPNENNVTEFQNQVKLNHFREKYGLLNSKRGGASHPSFGVGADFSHISPWTVLFFWCVAFFIILCGVFFASWVVMLSQPPFAWWSQPPFVN